MLTSQPPVAPLGWRKMVSPVSWDPKGALGHLPCLLADTADPRLLALLVGAATFADVELTVPTPALGVDKEGERRAATHAAVVHELPVLGEDAALAAFLVQLLLHLAGSRGWWREGEEKRDGTSAQAAPSLKRPTLAPCLPSYQVGSPWETTQLRKPSGLTYCPERNPDGGFAVCSSTCHICSKKAQNLTTYISDTGLKYKLL